MEREDIEINQDEAYNYFIDRLAELVIQYGYEKNIIHTEAEEE